MIEFTFTPAVLGRIRAMVADGRIESEIAAALGCPLGTLRSIARRNGIGLTVSPPLAAVDDDRETVGPKGWPRAWPLPIVRGA